AKGYAVLAPSLPLAQDEPPAPRLAEAILLAVDAARRQQGGLSATKLALSPQLADLVLASLQAPSGNPQPDWADWAAPAMAPAPWETASWK
ncbi:MAG: hypothetical protein VW600_15860, partial [Ferrovibrio sp.]